MRSPRRRRRRATTGPAGRGRRGPRASRPARWPTRCGRCTRASATRSWLPRRGRRDGHRAMTLLVVSPDYASHLLPLASLATAWRDAGERVVVATGPATAAIVDAFGYERADLRLGRGPNAGGVRAAGRRGGEDASPRACSAATRLGMVETLAYQARERLTD